MFKDKFDVINGILTLMAFLVILWGCSLLDRENEPLHYHSFKTNHEIGDMIRVNGTLRKLTGFAVTDNNEVLYQLYSSDGHGVETCRMEEAK